ncbi:prepilin-type N-terminal cleavage/methylation domain-containing protein [Desulfomicrobium apsheronum]|uniref:Prepilin-type N-terminal cleavage/methylation domain-containing protein n=1 Tax=Desulfomicrobium apsheronum TaxID=52560 RepID=A0A1I3VU12_9BACT|nr:prepilin-type N-terminal cleavage/methylation domain-containing protein [Desulfomicrobium apsheronum]SFJ98672.1 prepilin-type N-terminal cleavage/methylation domain-containing protein [Desulfomicrobium apsheronum]
MQKKGQQGFTLIEMAIVLVIIGLILGMVFKGRELIASAKVKSANAAYNKVVAGTNIYLDRYGVYPGDGCGAADTTPQACLGKGVGAYDGIVSDANEIAAFFTLLKNSGILTTADTKSALGDEWRVGGNSNATWVYVEAADLRLVCDLDRVADDGNPDTGIIRAGEDSPEDTFGGAAQSTDNDGYQAGADCWSKEGTASVLLKVLP